MGFILPLYLTWWLSASMTKHHIQIMPHSKHIGLSLQRAKKKYQLKILVQVPVFSNQGYVLFQKWPKLQVRQVEEQDRGERDEGEAAEIRAQLAQTGGPVAEVTVARLMIPPGKRYADLKAAFDPFDRLVAPQPGMRDDVVRLARACAEAGSELFVIVNNKVEGSSPRTVVALAELLAEA